MKINLKFAELHSPLFLCGTNLQQKLSITGGKPVALTYDRDNEELHVIHNGNATIIPKSSVLSMEPIDAEAAGIDLKPLQSKVIRSNPVVTKIIKAQVETPHDKVQNPPTHRTVRT